MNPLADLDPTLDLVLERFVDVPPERVWKVWTEPEHLKHWFTPRPWSTVECEVDLRPGGIFRSVMRSPDGEVFDNPGCILEVVDGERLVFTDCFGPGYRPSANPFFVAFVLLAPEGSGTRYTAIARHGSPETRQQHMDMGFSDGWGKALDQLVDYAQSIS